MSRIWWPYAWTTADRQSKHGISRGLPPGPDGLELISRGEFEEDAELARARAVAQLAQRLGFDLADTFTREGESLAHFLERVLAAVLQKPRVDWVFGQDRLHKGFGQTRHY